MRCNWIDVDVVVGGWRVFRSPDLYSGPGTWHSDLLSWSRAWKNCGWVDTKHFTKRNLRKLHRRKRFQLREEGLVRTCLVKCVVNFVTRQFSVVVSRVSYRGAIANTALCCLWCKQITKWLWQAVKTGFMNCFELIGIFITHWTLFTQIMSLLHVETCMWKWKETWKH